MWIELPDLWIAIINCLGIPATQLFVAWGTTRLPASLFEISDRPLPSRIAPGRVYDRLLLVRRWKHLLPDAAPWFQGFSKGRLSSTDPCYLRAFITETRRGEFSHWIQIPVVSAFILWTPYPAALAIIAWAVLSNIPCIITLRHTRIRLRSLLRRHTPATER